MKRKHPRLRLLCGVLVLALCTSAATQAGAVTQSEIDALKKEQQASQAKQEELKDQLAEAEAQQAAAQQKK